MVIPKHVAIIMDGNGRWAQNKGLPRRKGHQEGVNTLKKIAKKAGEMGIDFLTVYAFSTENWKRPKKEVNFLFNLFENTIKNELDELKKNNVHINVIGRKKSLPSNLIKQIDYLEKKTAKEEDLVLNIAFNYGGRAEIVDSTKKIITKKIKSNELDEKKFSSNLYLSNIPDVELLIRTGGEKRLSNFLLWELAYAELYFTDIFWPDFSEEDLKDALKEFNQRNRRFGSLNKDGDYDAF
ncbi:MAG: isoprenyl transferase [Bacillota bacterium]